MELVQADDEAVAAFARDGVAHLAALHRPGSWAARGSRHGPPAVPGGLAAL